MKEKMGVMRQEGGGPLHSPEPKMLGQHCSMTVSAPARWGRCYTRWVKGVVFWVCFTAVVAGFVYNFFDTVAMAKRKEVLVSICDERARMLQDQFTVSVNHVHALSVLISTFYYNKHSPVFFFGLLLLLPLPAFMFTLFMQRDPSPIHDEYAPVIFSQHTVSYLESLDMMSGEEDGENIFRARASGKAILTSPFRLLNSNHLGVLLTFLVYTYSMPPDATEEELGEI